MAEPLNPRSYAAQGKSLPAMRASSAPVSTSTGWTQYDALNFSSARSWIGTSMPMPGGGGNQHTTWTRGTLAAIARHLYENSPLAAYAVDTIARYSAPNLPQARTADIGWNKAAEEYFRDWMELADFSGRFDFVTLQLLASKHIDTDGDIVWQMTNEAGLPQIVTIESWRIASAPEDVDPCHAEGVILDAKGRVQGFSIAQGGKAFSTVPAAQCKLLFNPSRFSHYRGLTPFRRGSNDLRDAHDIKAFAKLATKIFASLPAVIKGGPLEQNAWGDDTEKPPAAGATEFQKQLSLATLLGGDMPVLPAGQEIQPLPNPHPGPNTMELIATLTGHFVAALGIPPAFFLDEKLTGPNQRSVNAKAQRTFNERQRIMASGVRWAWVRVIADAIAKGILPAVPNWHRSRIQPPAKHTIDAGRDAAQDREDVAAGLSTRQASFGDRGEGWQGETDQGFVEDDYIITRAKELAKKHGLPVELILSRRGFQPAKAAPATPPEKEDNEEPGEKEEPGEDESTATP